MDEHSEQMDLAAQEIEELTRDAERYRWIRRNVYHNGAGETCINMDMCGERAKTVDQFDDAIDAHVAADVS